jgi:two-component system, sensor histidine kinase and response regulator
MQPRETKEKLPIPFLAFMISASVIVIIGGISIFLSQRSKLTEQEQNELAAISSLKVAEISRWRVERFGDGKILSSILNHEEIIYNEEPEFRNDLLRKFAAFPENYDYKSILLLDSAGNVILRFPASGTNLSTPEVMTEISESREISISLFHYSEDLPGFVHLDVQVPLFSSGGDLIGAIIMVIDPYQVLFPLIQSWPVPSRTSETLIVRAEGDSLIYLNELRHRYNTAMKLKYPLKDPDLPAAKAVLGYEGVFEGTDYRGIPVISYLRKIPNSPWFMVAKVDKKEIYLPLREQTILIFSIVFLLVLSMVIFTIYYLRNEHIRYLKELNTTKDKFFSIVSHDLKSPFVSIIGFANMLSEDVHKKDLSKVQQYAGIILNSSQNAMDFLNNLSEWSRLQTNRIRYNPQEIDVPSLIEEIKGLMSAAAREKSIVIITKVPEALKINADKQMISIVLSNLLSNSIKFSHPGGKVYITVSNQVQSVRFEVRDNGTGMSKEILNKLFRIGETVSMPGTKREQGTGLGLILVREFVALQGGEIRVESEVGKGSTFVFTLPA